MGSIGEGRRGPKTVSECDHFVHFVVEWLGALMHNPEGGHPAKAERRYQSGCGWLQSSRSRAASSKQEEHMASSGTIRPLYGVIIRDKCKSSDVDTLKAYRTVAYDLLKDYKAGPDVDDLKESVKELEKVIAAKGK
jgi:hypothetical protein